MTRPLFRNTLIICSLILSSPFIIPYLEAQEQPQKTPAAVAQSTQPWLGVLLDKKTIFSEDGVDIARVMRKSPAEKAGILRGDRILEVEGQSVQSTGKLQILVRGQEAGATVKVSVLRGSERKVFNVLLTPAPTQEQVMADQLLNEPAPSVSLQVLSPNPRAMKLDELKGRPTIVEFWATWCQPCKPVAAELARLKTKHGERIHVVGVSSEEAAVISGFIEKTGAPPYLLARDLNDSGHDSFFVSNYPIVFLLNAEHRVDGIFIGRDKLPELESRLNSLLSSNNQEDVQDKANKKTGP